MEGGQSNTDAPKHIEPSSKQVQETKDDTSTRSAPPIAAAQTFEVNFQKPISVAQFQQAPVSEIGDSGKMSTGTAKSTGIPVSISSKKDTKPPSQGRTTSPAYNASTKTETQRPSVQKPEQHSAGEKAIQLQRPAKPQQTKPTQNQAPYKQQTTASPAGPPANQKSMTSQQQSEATPQTRQQEKTAPPSPQLDRAASTSQRQLMLYFSYGSYYSQKVLLSLYERGLSFTPQVISLDSGEQFHPSFITQNPKAEVPVLKVENKCIAESEVIINYIGRLPISSGTTLVGDTRSAIGQTIQRFRRLLDGVNIPLLTYGIVHHPHLSPGKIGIPAFRQQYMKDWASAKLNTLSNLSEKYPDHRDVYLTLSQANAQRYESITDVEMVKREVEQVGRVLASVETQYSRVKEKEGTDGKEVWLCGVDYTAADITLTILLTRISLLGLDALFLTDEHPAVKAYYNQAIRRPSYQKLLKETPGLKSMMIPYVFGTVRTALPYMGAMVAVGGAVGIGYWIYKKMA